MANLTLEAVENVMEQANADFIAAKQALLDTDGDVQAAVSLLTGKAEAEECCGTEEKASCEETVSAEAEEESCEAEAEKCAEEKSSEEKTEEAGSRAAGKNSEWKDEKALAEEIVNKIRAAIKAGNVDRILVRRNGEVLVNIPVNLGLVGSAIAMTAAPGALIAAAIAAYGFSCKIEIVRKDGSKKEL